MFTNQTRRAALSLAICLLFAGSVLQAQVVQTVGTSGAVDWSQQKIRATGIAAPNPNLPFGAQRPAALEAAKLVALRNLLQTVNGMAITSESTVKNMVLENDEIRTRVEGYVRGFTVVDTRYMSDTSVEVDVEVPLAGLAELLLPPGKVVPVGGTPVVPGTVGYPSTPAAAPASGAATGLIIDAKGLSVTPAMAPKVLDEDGNEVYGSKYVDREWAVKQGMVGYAKDVPSARSNQRVAPNPVVVKAIKAVGNNKADVVISNQDAQMLKQRAESESFLTKCQVMVVVD